MSSPRPKRSHTGTKSSQATTTMPRALSCKKEGTNREVTKAHREGAALSPTQNPHAPSATTRDTDPAERSSLRQDLQQVLEARPLQIGVPIRTEDKLCKQREPRQKQDPPMHGGSNTQPRVIPHNPLKQNPPKMHTPYP